MSPVACGLSPRFMTSFKEKLETRPLIIVSLFLSRFSVSSPRIIISLFLIEIAASFGSSVGVMGQITTVSSLVGMITSLLLGAISVRFHHKSLLVLGLALITVSTLGCFVAPNYLAILTFYSMITVGGAIAVPMTSTLVASHFLIHQRSQVLGWLVAGGALAVSCGAPIIARIGDWRLAFLGYVFPFALLSVVLAVTGIPSGHQETVPSRQSTQYVESFKAILANKSAVACLAGNALGNAGWQAIFLYSSSFFRQRYFVSTELASLLVFGGALCVTLGGLVSGRVINRVGRKKLAVLVSGLLGVCLMPYTAVSSLWFATVTRFLGSWLAGMMFSASASLELEQLPRFRGTMMSISAAMQSVGSALGAAIGGYVLLVYDYELVGISLGALAVIGAVIVHVLAVDPISPR
jgi:DHA1 family inner membrane transport protein